MRKTLSLAMAGSILFSSGPALWAAEDTLQFYQEEAQVVSASRQPQPANQAPATVFVVTQQDIKDSGAQSIPDALRDVPGVQVMESRTGQADVGIRGLDQPLNNKVLVLLDGKSILSGYFNSVTWESMPVRLDEIDRIEVVEGPAAAVYGADALSGVINIITKKPEQIQGGQVTYTGGERQTELGSMTVGRKDGPLGYRFGGGWHSTNRFEDAHGLATEAGQFDGLVNYDLAEHQSLSVSGGANNYNTQISLGPFSPVYDKGLKSYVRADYKFYDTSLRTYWNHERSNFDQSPFVSASGESASQLDTDSYDAELEQALTLPGNNKAVFGGNYHKNTARSPLLGTGQFIQQDLWSLFLEDKWQMASKWLLMASGRVDRHPLTPIRFSPRGSLLYTPEQEHVFRLSAGTSYRNPTLVENYLNGVITQPNPPGNPSLPNPPYTAISNTLLGSQNLDPETIQEQEVAYEGRFNRLKTTLTAFHYNYYRPISEDPSQAILVGPFLPSPPFPQGTPAPPTVNTQTPFTNLSNGTRVWGGSVDGEYYVTSWLRLSSNYTYEDLHGHISPYTPRHQANVGFRTKNAGWTTRWMLDWVDNTDFPVLGPTGPVSAYFMLNAHVGYAFSGAWSGLEMGVNSFNLLNHDHYETSPTFEGAELVKSRFTGTVSYKF